MSSHARSAGGELDPTGAMTITPRGLPDECPADSDWSKWVLSRYPRSAMDATEVRRWIAGFEAAAEADRQALRRRGADPAWSIRLSLSMIAAARSALGPRLVADPLREAEAERARAVWAQLRQRLSR
jgi:hypothetical protein